MLNIKKSDSPLALGAFFLSLTMFALSMVGGSSIGQTERAARHVRTRIENRIDILEEYTGLALASDSEESS